MGKLKISLHHLTRLSLGRAFDLSSPDELEQAILQAEKEKLWADRKAQEAMHRKVAINKLLARLKKQRATRKELKHD